MFVFKQPKPPFKAMCLAISAIAALTGAPALADQSDRVTLEVTLQNVENNPAPLYISVQNRAEYMKNMGSAGGIYKNVAGGTLTYSYEVPSGDYAVSIWHDTDGDGVFSMDPATYMPLDGWGASGPELRGQPTFDDTKIKVAADTAVTIKVHYPN